MKAFFITYKVDGRFHTHVRLEDGETIDDLLAKAEAAYYEANFGALYDISRQQTSVVDDNDHWYIDGGIWSLAKIANMKSGGYTVGFQIIGRADVTVKVKAGSTLDDVLDKADSEFCDMDFGDLEDIGDCDTRPITVQDEDDNWYLEDDTRYQDDDAVIA